MAKQTVTDKTVNLLLTQQCYQYKTNSLMIPDASDIVRCSDRDLTKKVELIYLKQQASLCDRNCFSQSMLLLGQPERVASDGDDEDDYDDVYDDLPPLEEKSCH